MNERRINVRGVVCDSDGNVLAVKHRDHLDGSESKYWAIPGGGLDQRESLHSGLQREFDEELGIIPVIGRILFMQQFIAYHRNGTTTEKLEVFFNVENVQDFKQPIDLAKTSHGHELFKVEFVPTVGNFILPTFLQDINVREFIDTNQPVLYVDNLDKPYQ